MVECKICGYQCKVLTKHLRVSHNLKRIEYETKYPGCPVVDESTRKRGQEISSYMHTDEVKAKASHSRLSYWKHISEEEKSLRVLPMITSKKSEEERQAQAIRARELSERLNSDPNYETYRKHRDESMSKRVKALWEDKEYRDLQTERLRKASKNISEKTREIRRQNMRKLNDRIYSDLVYRNKICSPLWGKGSSGGSRGGIRVNYVSRNQESYVFRSLWELNVAIYLDDLQLSWSYESLDIQYDEKHYIPDFYLSDLNLVLEVKPKDFIDEITESKRIATENLGYRFMYITEEDIDFLPLSSLDYEGEVVVYKENVQRLSKADKMKYLIS